MKPLKPLKLIATFSAPSGAITVHCEPYREEYQTAYAGAVYYTKSRGAALNEAEYRARRDIRSANYAALLVELVDVFHSVIESTTDEEKIVQMLNGALEFDNIAQDIADQLSRCVRVAYSEHNNPEVIAALGGQTVAKVLAQVAA